MENTFIIVKLMLDHYKKTTRC